MTGKGGYHGVYYPAIDEKIFKMFLIEKVIASLMASFPRGS
jgi:hypothetical protein